MTYVSRVNLIWRIGKAEREHGSTGEREKLQETASVPLAGGWRAAVGASGI